jgi:uncharacterized protein YdeI (YjbR/CyaY-like superfamily)
MAKTDPRIDAYIDKSQEFAKPIMRKIRELVHLACPEVEETMKWSMPFFDYKGVMCNMASFKAHCSFGFWRAPLMADPHKLFHNRGEGGMGHFGKISSLNDLPSDEIMIAYIKEACVLNETERPPAPKPKSAPKEFTVPTDLLEELSKNEAAATVFEQFSPSARKEYVEWITDAKTEATRQKRLSTTIEWLAEGKRRNWKYEKC